MKFKKEILKSLRDTKAENPKKLWILVGDIDFYIREIPSYEEMRAVLKALIKNGDVKESSKFQYYLTPTGEKKGTFTDFSENEYHEAVDYFREWLADEMESDTPMEKIVVLTLDQEHHNNKDLLSSLIYLSDEFIQLNASGVPIGVVHGNDSPVIELSTIDSIEPQEFYEFILPKIKEFIKEYGGSFKVSVGRKGDSKKEYYVQEK